MDISYIATPKKILTFPGTVQGWIQTTLRGGVLGAIEADKKQEKLGGITQINNLVNNVYTELPKVSI